MYRGDSDRTKRCRNSEINLASQVTGQTLFGVWGSDNPRCAPPQPLVRPYKKFDKSKGAVLEDLEKIFDVFDALKTNMKHKKVKEDRL